MSPGPRPRPCPGPDAVYLGLDGGGTNTTVVATDAAGRELARVRGGAGIVNPADPGARAGTLAELARRTLEAAGAAAPAAALCCALAGAGREAERRAIRDALARHAVAREIRVVGDIEAAFHDAFAAGPGLLIIAGTGSIAWGRAEDGRTARVGGWGHVLGDEGSGYAVGLAALRAVVRAHDGRAPGTALREPVLRHAGVDAPEGLIAWAAAATKADIAALTPHVATTAAAGDAVAAGILRAAAEELAAHARALYRRLGPWAGPAPVALTGGLLAPGGPLREATAAALRALELPLRLLDSTVDAARGAAALARGAAPPARA